MSCRARKSTPEHKPLVVNLIDYAEYGEKRVYCTLCTEQLCMYGAASRVRSSFACAAGAWTVEMHVP
jgi:hypothetical protein